MDSILAVIPVVILFLNNSCLSFCLLVVMSVTCAVQPDVGAWLELQGCCRWVGSASALGTYFSLEI